MTEILSSNPRNGLLLNLRALAEMYASNPSDKSFTPQCLRDAADEIERLMRELASANEWCLTGKAVVEDEELERLRAAAKRVIEAAQSTDASANSVLVHRQFIGELREALRPSPEGKP